MQPLIRVTLLIRLFLFTNLLTAATGDAFLSLPALIASRICTLIFVCFLFALSEVIKLKKNYLGVRMLIPPLNGAIH